MDLTELILGFGNTWNWLRIVSIVEIWYCGTRQHISHFKATAKSYNSAALTKEPRLVKTAQNSQCSNASNAVLGDLEPHGKWGSGVGWG
jgi:hypothetical protein